MLARRGIVSGDDDDEVLSPTGEDQPPAVAVPKSKPPPAQTRPTTAPAAIAPQPFYDPVPRPSIAKKNPPPAVQTGPGYGSNYLQPAPPVVAPTSKIKGRPTGPLSVHIPGPGSSAVFPAGTYPCVQSQA